MSFSGEVKNELLALDAAAGHCRLAELAAMISGAGQIRRSGGSLHVVFAAEKERLVNKYVKLLAEFSGSMPAVTQAEGAQQKNKTSYVADLTEEAAVRQLFLRLKILGQDGRIREQMTLADGRLLQKSCCIRAFLRGAFLTTGSMSDPRKSYHFEIICQDGQKAAQIQAQFRHFALEAKTVSRKGHEIVYLKEGSQIVDALNIMGAHNALMKLENVRIFKEMRNDINRRVNCETANINKTVNAAYRQQEVIRYLHQCGVFEGLSQQLKEIAALRMEYPEATIQELGTLCCPTVGKSGVNHRLRRLEEIAQQMGYEKKE